MTTGFRPCHTALFAALLMFSLSPAEAETWRAMSITVGDERMANTVVTFTDGLNDERSVLSNRPDGPPSSVAETRITIGFLDVGQSIPDASPVRIDQDVGTINLSSIYATGWRTELACNVHPTSCDRDTPHLVWVAVIGWDFGPVQALPFVKTIGGSRMASWNAVASRASGFDGFGNRLIQFTFEPSPSVTPEGFEAMLKATPQTDQLSGISSP